jgi:hypothetical protein
MENTEISPFLQRLIDEFKELKEKAWKLHNALYQDNNGYSQNLEFKEKVGIKQWDLMNLQLNCMNSYLYALGFRLADFNIDINEL